MKINIELNASGGFEMSESTLAAKIKHWAELQAAANELADEINREVLELRQTIKTDVAFASYTEGRGSYDYEAVAKHLEPDDEIIKRNTNYVIDWRKVCEEAGMTEELKSAYYRPGSPSVSLKLKKATGGER